jgi:hypothetical protein
MEAHHHDCHFLEKFQEARIKILQERQHDALNGPGVEIVTFSDNGARAGFFICE